METFKGENFCEFRGFVAICKTFLCKIWGCGIFWRHKQAICESFLRKNRIFHQFAKVFSLESFTLHQASWEELHVWHMQSLRLPLTMPHISAVINAVTAKQLIYNWWWYRNKKRVPYSRREVLSFLDSPWVNQACGVFLDIRLVGQGKELWVQEVKSGGPLAAGLGNWVKPLGSEACHRNTKNRLQSSTGYEVGATQYVKWKPIRYVVNQCLLSWQHLTNWNMINWDKVSKGQTFPYNAIVSAGTSHSASYTNLRSPTTPCQEVSDQEIPY